MLIDPDFEVDARTIRKWIRRGAVSTVQLIAELRDWADYLEDQGREENECRPAVGCLNHDSLIGDRQ